MALKYKLTILAVVISLAAAVLIITNQDLSPTDTVDNGQIELEDINGDLEEAAGADQEFSPANDPYQAYLEAIEAGKPAVIKFYARW